MKGVSGGEGVDITWPDLSLLCVTPLLQHLAQFGLNPALFTVAFVILPCWVLASVIPLVQYC